MLRHMVLLTLADDAPPGRAQEIADALAALPAQIPEMRETEVGVDLGLRDGNATVALTAVFDDADAWQAYQVHPAHEAVIRDLIRPVLAARTAAQVGR